MFPKEIFRSQMINCKASNLPLKVPIPLLEPLLNAWLRLWKNYFHAPGYWPHLRIRALYSAINSQHSWSNSVVIPVDEQEQLLFWYHNIECLNGKSILFSPGATRVAYSDASDSGYGG